MSSQRAYQGFRSMQPRLTTHRSAATSWITGKSITLFDACSTAQVSIQSGRGAGARFMKKNGPPAPFGYRFMTIARSFRWGSSTGARSR